ncbi:MAG TPA: hypothetical protein VHX86_08180 [Tepidisphaeraceae bacterium]|nr:hypothetical protein [Tepidisphaeraceae bacterium]
MLTRLIALAWFLMAAAPRLTQADSPLVPQPIPDGLGVNIHFTHPQPGEMKMLADSGIRWIRMDFDWEGTELGKGNYDFSNYDSLLKDLDEYHIRALWILDYGNILYDTVSPHTDDERAAFATWATAAVKHFAGRGVVWEMWNEPNVGFWSPKTDVDDYAKLAIATGKALHDAAPDEIYVGPALNRMDMKFCEACFKAGCLNYFSAVSVHPYRSQGPETVVQDYQKLRDLIAQYAPAGRSIPILSGEWGYSAIWKKYDETRQAEYLARQWLVNQWQQIPISIWYDWRDDGMNPKDPEDHFGMVHNPLGADPAQPYDPKPAYLAAKTLTTQLSGFRCAGRLATDRPQDYVLLFLNDKSVRLAAWTTDDQPVHLSIPASDGKFDVTAMTGESKPPVEADQGKLRITVSREPQYLAPSDDDPVLRNAPAEHP